jgi:hypothetical protein
MRVEALRPDFVTGGGRVGMRGIGGVGAFVACEIKGKGSGQE